MQRNEMNSWAEGENAKEGISFKLIVSQLPEEIGFTAREWREKAVKNSKYFPLVHHIRTKSHCRKNTETTN